MASTLKPDAAPFIPGLSPRGSASTFQPPSSTPSPFTRYSPHPFYDSSLAYPPISPFFPPVATSFRPSHVEYAPPDHRFTNHGSPFAQQFSEIHAMIPRCGVVNVDHHYDYAYNAHGEPAYYHDYHRPHNHNHNHNHNHHATKQRTRKHRNAFPRKTCAPEISHPSSSITWYGNQDVGYVGGDGMYHAPQETLTKKAKKYRKRNKNRAEEGEVCATNGAISSQFVGVNGNDGENDGENEKQNTNMNTNMNMHANITSEHRNGTPPSHLPTTTHHHHRHGGHKTTTREGNWEQQQQRSNFNPNTRVSGLNNTTIRTMKKNGEKGNGEKENGEEGDVRRRRGGEEEYFERKVWGSQREMKSFKGKGGG